MDGNVHVSDDLIFDFCSLFDFFFFCGFHVAHLVLTWTCILSVPQVLYWWPLIHTSSCRFMARRSSMPTAGKTWVTWTLIYSPWQRRLINRWAGKQWCIITVQKSIFVLDNALGMFPLFYPNITVWNVSFLKFVLNL